MSKAATKRPRLELITAKEQATPEDLLKMALELKTSLMQDLYPAMLSGVATMMEIFNETHKHEQLITQLLNDIMLMLSHNHEEANGEGDGENCARKQRSH